MAENGRPTTVGKHQLSLSLEEQDNKRNKMSNSTNSAVNDSDNISDISESDNNLPDTNQIDTPAFWNKMKSIMSELVDCSLATVTPRVEKNERKLEDLERKIQSLETTVTNQTQIIEALKISVTSNMATTDTAITKIRQAELVTNQTVSDLKTHVNEHDQEINTLFINNDELDQYGRRNTLRVTGIPESDNLNLIEFIVELAEKELKLKIDPRDIDRAHRLNVKTKKKKSDDEEDTVPPPRPVVVKFVSYQARRSLYDKRKGLKGTGIFLNEHLTRNRSKLLFDARQYKHDNKIKNAWSYDGRIMVKSMGNKFLTINNMRHLDYLINLPENKAPPPSPRRVPEVATPATGRSFAGVAAGAPVITSTPIAGVAAGAPVTTSTPIAGVAAGVPVTTSTPIVSS